jgi:site-specific DNA recombinase
VKCLYPCPSRYINAAEADRLVWDEVCRVLKEPEVVLWELQRRQDDLGARQRCQRELERVEKQLSSLGKEQQRLVRLYRYGEIDDEYIERELQRLARERDRLTSEKKALEERLAERAVTPDDIQAVREFCQRVAQNLGSLSLEEKRLALEALQVSITVEPDKLVLDGALPLSVASTPST